MLEPLASVACRSGSVWSETRIWYFRDDMSTEHTAGFTPATASEESRVLSARSVVLVGLVDGTATDRRGVRMTSTDMPDSEALTVQEAAAILRIGRNAAYVLARQWLVTGGREGLPCIELGRCLRVPRCRAARDARREASLPESSAGREVG